MLRVLKRRKLLMGWTNLLRTSEIRPASTVLKTRPAINDHSDLKLINRWESENIGISISRIEGEVVRTHKISKHYIETFLNFPKANLTNQMILSLIPCFGQIACADPPEIRINYVNKVWNKLKNSGVKLDVGHYNELLRVYLENEYKFSASEILEKMKEDNVKPNRVTYKYLLNRFCREGDLSEVSSLLKEMKDESIFLNETIFNELILGHCVAKDLDGANSVMKIMEEKNLEIGSSAYAAYLCGLAISGDIENFNSILNKCSEDKIVFRSEQLLDIIYNLATNGHAAEASKMINTYKNVLDKTLPQLFFRLLNKEQYDSCFHISNMLTGKEDSFVKDSVNLVCQYIAENESFENIKKLVNDWEQKGYGSDLLSTVLFYTLKKNELFTKSLSILKEFHETDQPVKQIYFWPMLANAIHENSPREIIDILKIMKNDFGFSFSKIFLEKVIFNNLLNQHSVDLVIDGLCQLGLSNRYIRNAFISSCMYTKRVDEVFKNSEFLLVPKDISRVNAFLVECRGARSPALIVNLMKNIYISAIKYPYTEKESNELNSDDGMKDILKIPQDTVDSIAKNLAKYPLVFKNDFMKNLFEEMLSIKLPISKTTGDIIKKTYNDPELGAVIDELTELPPFDTSQYLRIANNKTANERRPNMENIYQFLNYCNLGKIDEAEKLFNDHPSLQDNYFEKFLTALKRTKNDEKFDEYLTQYAKKIHEGEITQDGLFIQNELIQKGFIKEVFILWSKSREFRKRLFKRRTVQNMLQTALKEASWEDIVELINPRNGEKGVITVGEIIYYYGKNKDFEKILNILENFELDYFRNKELGKNLIIPLICEGEIEKLKNVISLLETKFSFSKVGSDLMLAYACIGNVDKARECLAKEKVKTLRVFLLASKIDRDKGRIQILENMLNILKGSKEFEIQTILYENLMEDYEKEKVDPNKGLALWEEMQEFHIVPTAPFMGYLAKLLKTKNMPIPFDDSVLDNEEWLLDSDLPRPLVRDLLEQYQHGEANGLSLVIEEGVKTGSIKANTIQRMLNGIEGREDKRDMKNNLRYCLSLAEYKQAFNERRLLQYVKNVTKSSDPDVLLNNIPHSFLVDSLMTERFDRLPSAVATIIMWACCHVVFKDVELAKIYEAKVQNSITDRTILEGVLKFAPYLTYKRQIINFLVSKEIFAQVGLDKEVKYVSNMANTSTKGKQTHFTSDGRRGANQLSSETKTSGIYKETTKNTDNRQVQDEVLPEVASYPKANKGEMNSEEEAKAVPVSSGNI